MFLLKCQWMKNYFWYIRRVGWTEKLSKSWCCLWHVGNRMDFDAVPYQQTHFLPVVIHLCLSIIMTMEAEKFCFSFCFLSFQIIFAPDKNFLFLRFWLIFCSIKTPKNKIQFGGGEVKELKQPHLFVGFPSDSWCPNSLTSLPALPEQLRPGTEILKSFPFPNSSTFHWSCKDRPAAWLNLFRILFQVYSPESWVII